MIHRSFRYYLFRVLRQHNSPEELAMGIAIGVFIGLAVPYGLQVAAIVLAACCFRRFNRIAALLGSLVTNPLTTPFVYLGYYGCARWLLQLAGRSGRELRHLDEDTIWAMLRYGGRFRDSLLAMGIVALTIGIVAAIAAYFISRPMIERYQRRRRERLAETFGRFMARAKALAHVGVPGRKPAVAAEHEPTEGGPPGNHE